jgi:hypothetical protein
MDVLIAAPKIESFGEKKRAVMDNTESNAIRKS